MDIRAILMDLDGTALMPNQVFFSFRTMKALRAAIAKGVEVIPCTGRNADTMPMQIKATPEIRYWVTSNGVRVLDTQTDELIYSSTFTPEESARLCRIFEGRGLYAEIAADGHIFMEAEANAHLDQCPVPWHHIWYLDPGVQIPLEKPSEYFLTHGIGIEKINFYGLTPEERSYLWDELEKTGIVNLFGSPNSLQFFPKRQDRRDSVDALLKRLGLGYENVMSFGDTQMDAFILERSALGVAMGNASDDVKKSANYITDTCANDGVAKAIEKFILNQEI